MSVKQQPDHGFSLPQNAETEKLKIGIVVAEWNLQITSSLLDSCIETLKAHHINQDNILVKWVPGSFELPLAAQWMFEYHNVDAVACLGCIIKGETPHFHYISEAVSLAISQLNLKYNRMVSFGIITAEEERHAVERVGGEKGNKGEEAAMALLKMLKIQAELKEISGGSPIGFR